MTTQVPTNKANAAPRWSWHNPSLRAWLYQLILLAVVGWAVWFLVSNTLANLAARNITTGFDFLQREAGFAVSESPVAYRSSDSYSRVIWVGLLNTLKVSALGIVLATLFGSLLGMARLSPNWLLSRLAGLYVEVVRNIPLLLQLFFIYALITESLPRPRQALQPLPGVFLSNRGFAMPSLDTVSAQWFWGGVAAAILLCIGLGHWARRRQEREGRSFPFWRVSLIVLIALPAGLVWVMSPNAALSVPQLQGFNFQGGTTLSPEFAALLIGLVVYTSAFIAEVVRSGIQSVTRGQWEAAEAIGLSRTQQLRLVVMPQALRVIIPPMTSQYLNLTKNSSLAVAIGYPDIVSVVNTGINQTGQAIEGILIIMAAYLTVSLSISVLMNLYNRRMALVER